MNDIINKPIDIPIMLNTMAKWIMTDSHINRSQNISHPTSHVSSVKKNTSLETKLKSIPGIDLVAAINMADDVSFYFELLNGFCDAYPSIDPKLFSLPLNWSICYEHFHEIQGVSGNLRLTAIFKCCEEIENYYYNKNENSFIESMRALQNLLEELTFEVNKIQE